MSEYLSKKALLEHINQRIADQRRWGAPVNLEIARELQAVANEIHTGAFDAPEMEHINAYWAREGLIKHQEAEVQRLRAIEQAIRDFQPMKEQQAGYEALVAWLESTTPFVLEPIEALSGSRKEDQE